MKVQTDVSVNPEKGNSTKPLLQAGGFNQHKNSIEERTKKVLKNERGQKRNNKWEQFRIVKND